MMNVVDFDQRLGALHAKIWLKSAFSMFFMPKAEKGRKIGKMDANLIKKMYGKDILNQ